jgi:hypothetical protein
MLDATASTKPKTTTAREQSMQMGGAHGAYGAMGGPSKTVHGMVAPSIFRFPAIAGWTYPPGGHPLVLRCSCDPPQAPTGHKDYFDFSTSADPLPICAAVLSDVAFKTADLDRLLNKALLSDVSVAFTNLTSDEALPFPFGVPLPMAVFLRPPDRPRLWCRAPGDPRCRHV